MVPRDRFKGPLYGTGEFKEVLYGRGGGQFKWSLYGTEGFKGALYGSWQF